MKKVIVKQNTKKAQQVQSQAETPRTERILNPDKLLDLFKIVQSAKDVNELKPILYKHILEIAKRIAGKKKLFQIY